LIANLAIPEEIINLYKRGIKELTNKIIEQKYQYRGLSLLTIIYGGSFDRHTYIRNSSDIDCYFIFHNFNKDPPTGRTLLYCLYENLVDYMELSNKFYWGISIYSPFLEFARDPPYLHAIPIFIQFSGYKYKVDCIPAIKLNNNNDLLIPEGKKRTYVNPTKEENALKKVNRKHNGRATKLIRLIKYWNEIHGHKLKSYLIERLVEKIFSEKPMNTWDKIIKTFFQEAIYILRERIMLENKVYSQKSILDEYSDKSLEKMIDVLRESAFYAQNEDWYTLFGYF